MDNKIITTMIYIENILLKLFEDNEFKDKSSNLLIFKHFFCLKIIKI